MRKIETAVKLLFTNRFWWNLLKISYFNKIFTVLLGIFKFAGAEKSLCGTYLMILFLVWHQTRTFPGPPSGCLWRVLTPQGQLCSGLCSTCYTSQTPRRRWLNIWTENRKGATLPRGPEEGGSTSGQRIERVLHFPEVQKKVGQHLDRESKGCYTSQRPRRRWVNIWTENRKGATLPRGPEEGGSTSGQRIERVLHFPEAQKKVAQHLDRESKGCYTSQRSRRRWVNIWIENRKGATLPRRPEEGGSTSGQRIERVLHFPEVQKKVGQHLDRESKGCYTSQRSRRRWINIWTENRKGATLPRGPEEGGSTSGQRIERVLHFPEVQKKVGQHLDRESTGCYTSQRSRRRWVNIWTENRKGRGIE